MKAAAAEDIELRRYETGDEPAVLALLQASLGWVPDDQYARFFRWKHTENAFGPSPAWVAVDDGRVVGFRVLMRWEFTSESDPIRAVRAVDTATHPDYQGRGIFSRLTLHAIDELRPEGVRFVFNTPNDQSRPGYLKMGWQLVTRLPVLARPRSPAALARLARARTPADRWSQPADAGLPVHDVLADPAPVAELLDTLDTSSAAAGPAGGLTTRRSVAYLRWRYGFGPLAYRALVAPGGVGAGIVIFRLRRRGPALEAAVCEELAPQATIGRLLRAVLRSSGADHAVRLGGPDRVRAGFVPLPGQGPTLVWRDVTGTDAVMPEPATWRLTLGDVELF